MDFAVSVTWTMTGSTNIINHRNDFSCPVLLQLQMLHVYVVLQVAGLLEPLVARFAVRFHVGTDFGSLARVCADMVHAIVFSRKHVRTERPILLAESRTNKFLFLGGMLHRDSCVQKRIILFSCPFMGTNLKWDACPVRWTRVLFVFQKSGGLMLVD
jgi:hypothetical protein